MNDNAFVPLVPRRLHVVGGQASLAPSDVGGQASLAPSDVGGHASLAASDVGGHAPLAPSDVGGHAPLAPSAVGGQASLARDESRIRAAAVELAAAACARALRYAVDRNPRLLERFVDDALRAAGSPKSATVRVAPISATAAAVAIQHNVVADGSLSPGDVFVEGEAGILGATIDERAARLVRAAAS